MGDLVAFYHVPPLPLPYYLHHGQALWLRFFLVALVVVTKQ